MGFDPRHWSGRDRSDPRVTSNVDALLAENDALRREVARLTRELQRIQSRGSSRQRAATEPPPQVSAAQVQVWGSALAEKPGWSLLRQATLMALVDQLNRGSFPADLTLQQRLDRLAPGLGSDLMAALGPSLTKRSAAILAAFALYGVRASEWLDEAPGRVVADLRQRVTTDESSARRRRTRSDRRTSDRVEDRSHQDPRAEALAVLGPKPGASREAIKQAFRQRVKEHHPDVGGSAEEFRRVSEAYQQLIQ